MSELQLSLVALGVAVVAGVIGFNKWQEIKHRRSGRTFASGHDDVLLGEVRTAQPAVAVPEPAAAPPEGERIEPQWDGPSGAAAAVDAAAPPAALAAACLDDRIDHVAEVTFAAALSGEELAAGVAGLDLQRAVACDGLGASGHWEAPVAGASYARARVGLQLTDRSGPIREADLAAFQTALEAWAARSGAVLSWPGAQNALTHAAQLDTFCAEVDVQIGLSLVAGATFAETKFRGLAEANGFRREDDGVFRRRDEDGREILSLRQSAPSAVTLTLDVPRVPREAAAFGLMAHCARTLAKGLEARIVDDNQRTLDDAMLAKIGQGIAAIQGRMEAAGLPAGGPLALRLFA
ncbi:MAG: hypothetical protein JNM90_07955 [Burkholderiales bacterium]|nr:hypothetical protein [Burkholderiales bacterium]